MKTALVIGSGFGGISAAAYLARAGYAVTCLEKNSWVGGRARLLESEGFRFDMGPSWYWMPEEHDRWFRDFGEKREEYYDVRRVDPSYKVFFGSVDQPGDGRKPTTPAEFSMPADPDAAKAVFESYEPGAGAQLQRYLDQAGKKYRFAMENFIYRNYCSIFDFVNGAAIRNLPGLNILSSYGALVRRYIKHPYLRKVLEFPVVFLGSDARRTPAMYTLMNHIDFNLGTWYPAGGFAQVVRSMQQVAQKQGVEFHFNHEVTGIDVAGTDATVRSVRVSTPEGEKTFSADVVVANADYHFVETQLLPEEYRSISAQRWNRAALAPSTVSFFLGFNTRLKSFSHHTFFFDADWNAHFDAVYRDARWIEKPLFYLHIPSITDPKSAPPGHEAVFLLVPVAPGLDDTPQQRERYFEQAMDRIEELSGQSLREHLVFKQSYSLSDYTRDYHAYKGNAFGLGQTLFQTAYFRHANRSKRVNNLYYAGQYTVPGTGTTMSMISGNVVSERIQKEMG